MWTRRHDVLHTQEPSVHKAVSMLAHIGMGAWQTSTKATSDEGSLHTAGIGFPLSLRLISFLEENL